MILGVNGLRLVKGRSGVARVIEAILRSFGTQDHPFTEVRVYTPRAIEDADTYPTIVRNVVIGSRLPFAVWEQVALPAAHGGRGLLLCPSYIIPFGARCPTFVIHHGSYEGYPQAFPWWPRTKAKILNQFSARHATTVTTVSHYSKRDMVRFYGVPAAKIHVVPNGVDTRLFHPIRDEERLAGWRRRILGADVPFFLYVGRPSSRRNLPNLFAAFGALKNERQLPHKLLLIGTALEGISLDPVITELGLGEHIVRVPHAEHADIALAYNASEMLVYPSSYEGFGMPVLEAMACGTPAIALDNTAFPEFAGGVAWLLPDAKVETLQGAMGTLLVDADRRRQMAVDGPLRAAAYDWNLITRRYLDLMIETVAGGTAQPPAAS